ncbi:MAG: hypothetical protein Hyperionvirus8_64 [Hyperionvirus sp.]|uniref:Uncharacterized protein n=1 Tax=Hyperionvirus sp. TaxID=2487770 RepID=A0A3G5A8H6_9VIRU|nr:MAG: hypothetical protein Hyperionvirus8_64 [Hyperionvirus sp.]
MSYFTSPITPNFITYSDSYMPIIPSSVSLLRPTGAATIIMQGPLPLPWNYDLNRDERTHRIQSKYFMFKTLDKWIYEDMIELLNYFVVEGDGKVRMIRSLGELKPDAVARDTVEGIEKKIEFIEAHILTEGTMHKILKKFVRGTGIGWVDLHKNERFVKEAIKEQLTKILRETILEHEKVKG